MFARHASATLRRTGASLLINSSVKATRASVPALCNWGAAASGLPISSNLRSFQSSPITSGNASASASAMEGSAKVRFSAGADETALTAALQELLGSAGKGGRWSLIPNGQGLERGFKFKTFVKTWDFMTAVSLQCKLKNHHPEWSNVYNTVYIRWTTYNPEGLSAKDVELAELCDALARDFGEVVAADNSTETCALRQVADRVASDAGDCCTPRRK